MKLSFLTLALAVASAFCLGCARDPMLVSSALGDVEMARAKLRSEPGLSLERRRMYMQTGAYQGHVQYVQFWAENGCGDPESLGLALLRAAYAGRPNTAYAIIEAGADPDFDYAAGTKARLTPVTAVLLLAGGVFGAGIVERPLGGEPGNTLETLRVLHESGADMQVPIFWESPDQYSERARRRGYGEVVDYFVSASRSQVGTTRAERKAHYAKEWRPKWLEGIEARLRAGVSQLQDKVALIDLVRAARGGDAAAMRDLANRYASGGAGLRESDEEAVEWWRKAAQLNDQESQAELRRRGISW